MPREAEVSPLPDIDKAFKGCFEIRRETFARCCCSCGLPHSCSSPWFPASSSRWCQLFSDASRGFDLQSLLC